MHEMNIEYMSFKNSFELNYTLPFYSAALYSIVICPAGGFIQDITAQDYKMKHRFPEPQCILKQNIG